MSPPPRPESLRIAHAPEHSGRSATDDVDRSRLLAAQELPGHAKVRRQRKDVAWIVFLALGAAGTICYFFAPHLAGSGIVFNVLGLSAAVAILVGVRIHRPRRVLPWYLFAIAQLMFVIGDFSYYTLPEVIPGYQANFPSWGDVPYLSVYPLIIAGLLLLIRARNPRGDRAAIVDALIIGIGVGIVSWVYLMVPYARDEHLALGPKLISIAYPLMDVLVLAVTVRLAVDVGRRPPAFYMVVVGIASLVCTDAIYGFIVLHSTYQTGSPLDVGWLAYYFSWAAAALHPSMRTLSEPVPEVRSRLTRKRLAVLTVATLMAPVVQLTQLSWTHAVDAGVLVSGSIVLFLLVVLRLRLVVLEQEAAAERERALRSAGAALVVATTKEATYVAAIQAIRQLSGQEVQVLICEVKSDGELSAAAGTTSRESGRLHVSLHDIVEDGGAALMAGRSVSIARLPHDLAMTADLSLDSCVFAVPLAVQGRLGGLVLVAAARPLIRPVRDSIDTLASQIALAVDSNNLAEDLHRRQSEARFGALVQNSSDVVTVIDATASIRYQSPSIQHVFGHDATVLLGTSLLDLLHEDDTAHVRQLLTEVARGNVVPPQLLEARWRDRTGAWRFAEMLWTDLTADPNVDGVVLNTRDISERKAFERELAHQAFHDPITNLANRALFRDRVQHAVDLQQRDGDPLAVVFLDLDDFKTVNDSLGHGAGDQLLAGLGDRLQATIRSADTAARLGGDEFALLLEHVDAAGAELVVETVRAALDVPFVIDGREVFIRASFGIAMSQLADSPPSTAENLLRDADVAMYTAKELGKNRSQLFEPAMHQVAVSRLELKAELLRALANDEFCLYYQPVVEFSTERIVGLEALVRWNHPIRGLTPPGDFIPLAEETGLVIALGRWVLLQACREARTVQLTCPAARDFTISVNLSARQLQHDNLFMEVTEALATSGLNPRCLILEITETMMVRDPVLSGKRLRELKRLGVQVAIDDFGTAYSSLNYLRTFPIDVIKVDKSFVDQIARSAPDRAIAETILQLAGKLDLKAVAEGIETPAQLETLRGLGCAFGQGYLLARPMAYAALVDLLHNEAGIVRLPVTFLPKVMTA